MAEEFRYIVRIAGVDLPGDKALVYALARIKGVGINLSRALCRKLNLDPNRLVGTLSDEEIEMLNEKLRSIDKLGFPPWMLNRRRDPFLGTDRHLITSDLVFEVRKDIEFMKAIRSYKGVRHMYGLKVRGQRTRTTGRFGMTLGVKRGKGARK